MKPRVSPATVRQIAHEITGQVLPEDPAITLAVAGFDSLAFAELGAALEERAGLELPARADPVSVGDLMDLVADAVPCIDRPAVPVGLGRYQSLALPAVESVFRRYFRITTIGAQHIPQRGPILVCLNHDSSIDVLVTAIAAQRRLAVMGKEEIFIGPVVRWLFHELGAFPVDREQFDRRAVEVALAILHRGHALAMWPEGTRDANVLLPFTPGAAWIALRTGVPIVPGAVVGTGTVWPRDKRLPRRGDVTVAFSSPIHVERIDDPVARRAEALVVTAELRERIVALLKEHGSSLSDL